MEPSREFHPPLLDQGTRAVKDLKEALFLLDEFHKIGGADLYETARERGLWSAYQNLISRQRP